MSTSFPERPRARGRLRGRLGRRPCPQAGAILGADPGIAGRSLLAATVLGDAEAVHERLAVDPRRRWPLTMNVAGPLCYMRATRSGITSTPAGRRDWPTWSDSSSTPVPARARMMGGARVTVPH